VAQGRLPSPVPQRRQGMGTAHMSTQTRPPSQVLRPLVWEGTELPTPKLFKIHWCLFVALWPSTDLSPQLNASRPGLLLCYLCIPLPSTSFFSPETPCLESHVIAEFWVFPPEALPAFKSQWPFSALLSCWYNICPGITHFISYASGHFL